MKRSTSLSIATVRANVSAILAVSCALPALAVAGEAHEASYFASPSGGAYGAGSVFKIVDHRRTVLYDFCPQPELGCPDGASPLANPIMMSDGSILGATSAGGDSGYADVPGGGVLFKLEHLTDGTWKEHVLYTFCPFWSRCDAFGSPVGAITLVDPDTVEGLIEGAGGEKGEKWQFKLTPPMAWRPVQTWVRH